jgi:hypothetical protein
MNPSSDTGTSVVYAYLQKREAAAPIHWEFCSPISPRENNSQPIDSRIKIMIREWIDDYMRLNFHEKV